MTLRSIKDIDKKIADLIKNKIDVIAKDDNLKIFTKLFYSKITNDDFLNQDYDYLYHVVKSSFDFLQIRQEEQNKINVFTPEEGSNLGDKYSIIEFVARDTPFIVDSITAEITKQGYAVERIINRVICLERDSKGRLKKIFTESHDAPGVKFESVIHIQISKLGSEADIKILLERLKYVLSLVQQAVADWHKVLDKLNEVRNHIKDFNLTLHKDDLSESLAFIDWIEDNAFVFLGYAEYSVKLDKKNAYFKSFADSKLGILKLYDPDDLKVIRKDLLDTSNFESSLIEITKSENKSLIHRPTHLDVIRVKKYASDGHLIGEYRFFGLFTSIVFYQNAKRIPIIRKKIEKVISQSGFDLSGHNGKELVSVLAAYPREELFQINQEELFETAMGIVSIAGRAVSKLFARKDKFGRFASVTCYVPKKNFSSGIREKIQNVLAREFEGEVTAHYTQISESILARVNFIVRIRSIVPKKIDYQKIEKEILDLSTPWCEKLSAKLDVLFSKAKASSLFNTYKNAFSLSYIEHFSQNDAAQDIRVIDDLLEAKHPLIKLLQHHTIDSRYYLKIYSHDQQISLSEIMPILENFGLEVIE